jgi:hypothetical protein
VRASSAAQVPGTAVSSALPPTGVTTIPDAAPVAATAEASAVVAASEAAAAACSDVATTATAVAPETGTTVPMTDPTRLVARSSRRPAGASPFGSLAGASFLGGDARSVRVLGVPSARAGQSPTGQALAGSPSVDGTDESGKTALPAASASPSASSPAVSDLQSASAQSAAAASAASALGATVAPPRLAADVSIADAHAPTDLAQSADKLMGQVVQTIHTYQTSGGPAIEARISDPNLGDVRLIVTGRAGEIVQAQLVVGDRATADALTAAAARVHATGDGLVGVNVTVRSEAGGSWTAGGRSGNSESAAWTAADGWGSGSDSGSGSGHGGQGASAGSQAGSGSGNGGASGSGAPSDGSRGSGRSTSSRFDQSSANADRVKHRPSLAGGSSLDIRA